MNEVNAHASAWALLFRLIAGCGRPQKQMEGTVPRFFMCTTQTKRRGTGKKHKIKITIMAGTIDQVINSKNEDGSGMVTVVAVDDRGNQHSATREYSNWGSAEENATQSATQAALDKC